MDSKENTGGQNTFTRVSCVLDVEGKKFKQLQNNNYYSFLPQRT